MVRIGDNVSLAVMFTLEARENIFASTLEHVNLPTLHPSLAFCHLTLQQ